MTCIPYLHPPYNSAILHVLLIKFLLFDILADVDIFQRNRRLAGKSAWVDFPVPGVPVMMITGSLAVVSVAIWSKRK
jgi:hypothetical protein